MHHLESINGVAATLVVGFVATVIAGPAATGASLGTTVPEMAGSIVALRIRSVVLTIATTQV